MTHVANQQQRGVTCVTTYALREIDIMAYRQGHGTGKGTPHIEVLPPDEQPKPVPAPERSPIAPLARRLNGTFAGTEAAREAGRRGGRARARKLRLVDSLGLSKLAVDSAFAPYRSAAEEFTTAHLASLASEAGGHVGPGPASMVASAALQLACSRYCFDRACIEGDPALMRQGSQLADASRQNLLAARELAVREAQARDDQAPGWSDRERLASQHARNEQAGIVTRR
jgi:hypothetical protein